MSFCGEQNVVELVRCCRRAELLAHALPPHQVRDLAEDLDVQAGGARGSHDKKEEAHRLAVDGIEGYSGGTDTADQAELSDAGRAGVRNGNSEADPRAPTRFPLPHRPEHFCVVPPETIGQVPGEFRDHTGLVTCHNRHDDLIGSEYLGQEHGLRWKSMDQT